MLTRTLCNLYLWYPNSVVQADFALNTLNVTTILCLFRTHEYSYVLLFAFMHFMNQKQSQSMIHRLTCLTAYQYESFSSIHILPLTWICHNFVISSIISSITNSFQRVLVAACLSVCSDVRY